MKQVEGSAEERRFLWSNLYRVDCQRQSETDDREIWNWAEVGDIVRTAQRSLLLDEIAILNPGAVIFLTGPNYDREIKAEFPDVQFHSTSDIPVRMLARLKHPYLPEKTFRTYHPHYLQRARQWQLLEKIGKFVAS